MRRTVRSGTTAAAACGAALAVTLAAAFALPAAGSGVAAPTGSVAAGAKVFASAGCGSCHTLARAGAAGRIGPSLDRLKPTSARVARQVRAGGGAMPPYADRLSAKQIGDVAAFVAAASRGAATGAKPVRQRQDGRSLFRTFCGGCHTLAAAGTRGTRGPSLDDERPSVDKVVERVLGGDDDGMPSFRGTLTPTQIRRIARYVSTTARGRDD